MFSARTANSKREEIMSLLRKIGGCASPAIAGVALALLILPGAASATLCGDTVATSWSVTGPGTLGLNEASFTACGGGPAFVASGQAFAGGSGSDQLSTVVFAPTGDRITWSMALFDVDDDAIMEVPTMQVDVTSLDWAGGAAITGFTIDFDNNPLGVSVTSLVLGPNSLRLTLNGGSAAFPTSGPCAEIAGSFNRRCDFAFSGLFTVADADIPEPGTLALFAGGLAGLGAIRRRRKL